MSKRRVAPSHYAERRISCTIRQPTTHREMVCNRFPAGGGGPRCLQRKLAASRKPQKLRKRLEIRKTRDAPPLGRIVRPLVMHLTDTMSAQGQTRKSVTATKMSAFGGRADIDFGRLEVCS